MPSLLQSLSSLDNVAPVEEDDNEVPFDPRAHYQEVGPSVRRRKANLTETPDGLSGKYQGREGRLKDLEAGSEGEEDDEEDEEEEEESEEDEEAESEDEDIASSSSSSSHTSPRLQPAKKSVRFGQNSFQDAPNGSIYPSDVGPSRTLSSSLSTQAQLAKSLREQAREDAQAGDLIQRQLSFWQRALEIRIKVDKILGARGLGNVDPLAYSGLLTACDAETKEAHETLITSLLNHSASLLGTQVSILGEEEREHQALFDSIEQVGSKRKRSPSIASDSQSTHMQLLSLTLQFGREIIDPLTSSTLDRLSSRGGASNNSDNSFASSLKTFDQSLTKQIEAALSGEGEQRLVERTRKYRGESRRIGTSSTRDDDREDSTINEETFDDSDFYSSLLRSLIDSSSHGAISGGGDHSNIPIQFHPRTNTKVRGIDTRASKGRKLRYEVIEKIANFMPKVVGRERWTDEQKGRLLDVLPAGQKGGKQTGDDSDEEDQEEEPEDSTPMQDLGGLKLFG